MNIPSFLGDLAHLAAYLFLIFRIEKRQSSVGISGKMQVLLTAAILTRYWDFVYFFSIYLSIKNFIFICLSLYLTYIIFIKYRKTYEKRCDSFWIESIILTSITLSFCLYIQDGSPTPEQISRLFSHFVESLSIIPQVYFYIVKQQKDETIICYIALMTLYRTFYIIYWVISYLQDGNLEALVFYPGILQTTSYAIFLLFPKGKKRRTSCISKCSTSVHHTAFFIRDTTFKKICNCVKLYIYSWKR
nr:ER lumen protein-retaining receptor 2-like isoform X2 [Halyomorpha halys]